MRALLVAALVLIWTSVCAARVDWNAREAADYLDGRQRAWFDWNVAKAPGGTCLSCHTGATYLQARPVLRRILKEPEPTEWEIRLLYGLRTRSGARDAAAMGSHVTKEPFASQALGVETVFAALFLGTEAFDSAPAQAALDRLWSLQERDGRDKGAWPWFNLNLDPFETPDSVFYGASLAAMATGAMPASYRERPGVKRGLEQLCEYLDRSRDSQPLHNRLMLLWAASGWPQVLSPDARDASIREVFGKQETDGGWSVASLGPWKDRGRTLAGSNAYATGFVSVVLQSAGIRVQDGRMRRALEWLAAHQDAQGGYWEAQSMNKAYPAGSMQEKFMRDAATAYAALALAGSSAPANKQGVATIEVN